MNRKLAMSFSKSNKQKYPLNSYELDENGNRIAVSDKNRKPALFTSTKQSRVTSSKMSMTACSGRLNRESAIRLNRQSHGQHKPNNRRTIMGLNDKSVI